jgi:hypothetical protein
MTTLKGRPVAARQPEYLRFIKELCELEGHTFIGPFTNLTSETKLSFICKAGHTWNTTTLTNVRVGRRCPECFREKSSDNLEVSINKILENGIYGDKYIFCREHKLEWKVKCKLCEVDEYSRAGIGGCVFKVNYNSLMRGNTPCRCLGGYRALTEEQLIYKANKHARNKKWKCEGVCEDNERLKMNCVDHGNWFPMKSNFLRLDIGCPSCAESGFDRSKPAVFYVLVCESEHNSFVGFGITKDFGERVKRHKQYLSESGYKIKETYLFEMSGEAAYLLEKKVLNEIPIINTEINGFKREAAHIREFSNIMHMAAEFTI